MALRLWVYCNKIPGPIGLLATSVNIAGPVLGHLVAVVQLSAAATTTSIGDFNKTPAMGFPSPCVSQGPYGHPVLRSHIGLLEGCNSILGLY